MYPAGIPGIDVRYVTLADGLSVRVISSGPPKEDAIVLLHGWGACVYSYAETIPALASAGHHVIAMDLPGYGLSDKPANDRRYTTRAMSDVVCAVTKAMGVKRFSLVAHSMGGAIALDIATRDQAGLQRLVLINAVGLGRVRIIGPVKIFSPRIVNRITPALITRRIVRIILHTAFATRGRPTERDVDEYFAASQFDEYAWACRACIHQGDWRRIPATKLRSLRVPVLVITGGRDLLTRGAAKRAKLIASARVVTIPEAGHLVMQECSPRTNQEILQFLRAAAGPSPTRG